MDWLIWLIVGALVWQGITCIVFILSDENEGATALVGAGLAVVLVWAAVSAVRKVIWFIRKQRKSFERSKRPTTKRND